MRENHPPEVVPAPWVLHGAAYAQCFWDTGESAMGVEGQRNPRASAADGPGVLAFLRYHVSNVGPYHELLWLSLKGTKVGGIWRPSVTKIYVSTEASLVSGRANWAIPKELAMFEVKRIGPRAERVRVSRDGADIAALTIQTSRISVPFNLALLPRLLRTIVQVDGGRVHQFAPVARGRVRTALFSELDVNPELFPGAAVGRRIGAFSTQDLRLEFPAAEITQ